MMMKAIILSSISLQLRVAESEDARVTRQQHNRAHMAEVHHKLSYCKFLIKAQTHKTEVRQILIMMAIFSSIISLIRQARKEESEHERAARLAQDRHRHVEARVRPISVGSLKDQTPCEFCDALHPNEHAPPRANYEMDPLQPTRMRHVETGRLIGKPCFKGNEWLKDSNHIFDMNR